MQIFAMFASMIVGLCVLVFGYDARYRLPVELRSFTGLTRIPVGILLIAIPLGFVLSSVGQLLHVFPSI